MQFGKYADLRAQQFRNHRNGDVVHRAALVSLELIQIGQCTAEMKMIAVF